MDRRNRPTVANMADLKDLSIEEVESMAAAGADVIECQLPPRPSPITGLVMPS